MFNYERLAALKHAIKEAQFVPMDPSMAGGDPAAGGMPPPGDPAAAGAPPPEDPAAGGMPPGGDPGAMPPPGMDPNAMAGGMPPPGMDPSMMDPAAMGMPAPDAGGEVSPTGEPYMKITPTQLSKLFKQFAEVFKSVLGIQAPATGQAVAQAPAAPQGDPALAQKMTELDAKIDALLRG